jgi:hypothetical protein
MTENQMTYLTVLIREKVCLDKSKNDFQVKRRKKSSLNERSISRLGEIISPGRKKKIKNLK